MQYAPVVLTLVTTHKCTVSCSSCCFNCSPSRTESMELSDLKEYVDISINSFPSIEVVVLTGGETFLLGLETLADLIKYIKTKYGKITRIVSNGFWAKSAEITRKTLLRLFEVGLDELNLSTGDVHLMHVSLKNILNVIHIHERNDFLKNLSIAVEDHENSKFDYKKMQSILTHLYPDSYKTVILHSPWIELDKKEDNIIHSLETSLSPSQGQGCYSLYNGIQVTPTGQILACCGFAAEYSPLLKMGSIRDNKDNLKVYLEEQYSDYLKMWLMVEGPRAIYTQLTDKYPKENLHDCEICLHLLSNADLLKKIVEIPTDKVKEIILKFHHLIRQMK